MTHIAKVGMTNRIAIYIILERDLQTLPLVRTYAVIVLDNYQNSPCGVLNLIHLLYALVWWIVELQCRHKLVLTVMVLLKSLVVALLALI